MVLVLPNVGAQTKSAVGGAFGGGSGPARRYTVRLVASVRGCSTSTKPTPAAVVAKDTFTVVVPLVALRLYSADGVRFVQDQWIGIASVGPEYGPETPSPSGSGSGGHPPLHSGSTPEVQHLQRSCR